MNVASYITSQKGGERSQEWLYMEEQYNKKLWYQLTLALIKYVKTGPHAAGHLSKLYKTFLSDFDHRVSCTVHIAFLVQLTGSLLHPAFFLPLLL